MCLTHSNASRASRNTPNRWMDGRKEKCFSCVFSTIFGRWEEFSFVAVDSDVIETWELRTAGILLARVLNR